MRGKLTRRIASAGNQAKLLRRVMTRCGSDDIVVHSARHTFVTLGGRAEIPLDVMQEILGHSKTERVTGGYGWHLDEVLIEAVEDIWSKCSTDANHIYVIVGGLAHMS